MHLRRGARTEHVSRRHHHPTTAPCTTTTPPKKRKITPTPNRRWGEFQRQARRRNLSVNMKKRHYQTLIMQPCVYCGRKGVRVGVDRVDNHQHYTTENTLPCCAVCNFMKRDLGLRAFVGAAGAIAKGPMSSFARSAGTIGKRGPDLRPASR